MQKNKEHLVVKINDQERKHFFLHAVSMYRKDWCQ